MTVSSPFSKFNKNQEKRLTRVLLMLTVVCIVVLKYFDQFLMNETCTGGIVSFELAEDLETASAYLNSWGEQGRIAASMSMGFDFLFPIVYTSFIALLIHKLNVRLWINHAFFKVGNLLIWAIFVAGVFDYIENVALINLLLGNMDQFWVSVSYYFATIKFSIIFIGFVYILLNFSLFLIKKRK
ncbi:MAG: hypothetical protein JKY02_02815 [Flavobacteriaceae bacterium]|nr:hypothetical protein [Flavobacteriaceae bacterium]